MIQIEIPEKVSSIIETLTEAGFEAHAVGGCVRDAILGRVPADWDITTSASPWQVKELFARTVDTGIQHGTVTVMLGKEGFEVTTYRVDGEYEDCRHPKEVVFTKSLLEDLKRRDFTINAMAYNRAQGLVDEFDGIGDLKRGIIRCVGNAHERFQEDALRMLRAVRFAAQLGFQMEEGTRAAIGDLKENLRKVSAERIQTELVKLLVSPHPERILEAWETGITGVVLPEWDACMRCPEDSADSADTVGFHTVRALQAAAPEKVLRLTMLFHEFGKPQLGEPFCAYPAVSAELAVSILKRLKFDNDTIRQVKKLVSCHQEYPEQTPAAVRRTMNRIGLELFPQHLQVQKADLTAQHSDEREEKQRQLEETASLYKQILERGDCVTLKQLAVTGSDLMAAGIPAGPKLGEILSELLELVLEDPSQNEKDHLLQKAKECLMTSQE